EGEGAGGGGREAGGRARGQGGPVVYVLGHPLQFLRPPHTHLAAQRGVVLPPPRQEGVWIAVEQVVVLFEPAQHRAGQRRQVNRVSKPPQQRDPSRLGVESAGRNVGVDSDPCDRDRPAG